MKKSMKTMVLTALFIVLIMTSAAACQATPEEPIVVGKDQQAMLDAAAQTVEPGMSLSERVNAPAAYKTELVVSDRFKLTADAEVTVPDADGMPIIRVKAADFTQPQVDGMIKALFKGQKIYETSEEMSKEEITDMIVNLNRVKTLDDFAGEEEMMDTEIAQLEAIYDSAPEKRVYTESNGQLKKKELADRDENPFVNGEHVAYYTGLYARTNAEDGTAPYTGTTPYSCIDVRNNNDLTKPNADETGGFFVNRCAMITYGYYDPTVQQHGVGSDGSLSIPIDENTVISDPVVLERLKLTPAQAKQQVEEMLQTAGITDMQICGIYLSDDSDAGLYGNEKREAQRNAYRFCLCRMVDGVPCGYSKSYTDADDATGAYFGSWNYESFDITVDDTGIVDVSWMSPLSIGEKVVESAALLPFDRIAERFEQQIKNSYAYQDSGDSIEVNVYRVSLELMRITEQNSIEKGLLVPVWNFYATKTKEAEGWTETTGLNGPWAVLSINAVDGSVINVVSGY